MRFAFSPKTLLLLCLASATACGGEAVDLSTARTLFQKEAYEQALEHLESQGELPSDELLHLRQNILDARALQRAGLKEVDAIVAQSLPLGELDRRLREGPGRIRDERVQAAVAQARTHLAAELVTEERERRAELEREPKPGAASSPSKAKASLPVETPDETAQSLPQASLQPETAEIASPEFKAPERATVQAGATQVGEVDSAETASSAEATNARAWPWDPELFPEPGLLRRELIAAGLQNTAEFKALGIHSLTEAGVRLDTQEEILAWADVAPELLGELASATDLSGAARLGLAMEILSVGGEEQADKILVRALRSTHVDSGRVDQIISWYRDEPVPAGGYVWINRIWVEAGAVPPEEPTSLGQSQLNALARRFPRLGPKRRQQAFDDLIQAGLRESCIAGIQERWKRVESEFHSSRAGRGLLQISEARKELDELRRELLLRIRDEEAYPSDRATPAARSLKSESQDIIEEKAAALSQVLKETRDVSIDGNLRFLLDEIDWLGERGHELALAHRGRPEGLPEWLDLLDPMDEEVTLANFALTPSESRALGLNRRVLRHNAGLLNREQDQDPALSSHKDELEEVELVNAYRVLLGLPALRWNQKLKAAAWDHSDYLNDMGGEVGHTETRPGLETSFDRMRRRGYREPRAENCYRGDEGPAGVHRNWIHSPVHHRILVDASHTEMATARVGSYWTQVFGADTDFKHNPAAWSD